MLISLMPCTLWHYVLWSFQTGDTKLEIFLHNNQHTQKKIVVFSSFGLRESCQKVPKFDFQSQFSMSKIIQIFLNFFSLKNTNLEAQFLLLAFFDKINSLTTLLLKLGQIFDDVAKLGKSTQDAYNPEKWLIL